MNRSHKPSANDALTFCSALENSPDAVFLIDSDSNICQANATACQWLGYSKTQFLAMPIADIDQQLAAKTCHTETANGKIRRFETVLQSRDGTAIPVEITAKPFPVANEQYCCIFAREISHREKSVLAFQEREQMLQAIVQALPDLVFVLDEDGTHLEVLTSQKKLLFRNIDDIRGRRLHEIFPEPLANSFLALVRQTIESGEPGLVEYKLPILGETRCFEARTAPVKQKINGKNCIVWVARDNTERNKTEQALVESEASYRFLYNNTPVMMKAINRDSVIINANEYYIKMLGYKRDEVIGHKSTGFLTAESQRKIAELLPPEALLNGDLLSMECQMVRKNGEMIDAEVFAAAELGNDGEIKQILSFFVDRTDRKRVEELQTQNIYLREELKSELNFGEIRGVSAAIKKVFKNIEMVAATDATVLLLGETGTGKELITRAIHNLSNQKNDMLIKVNCGALPAGLVESELFGHEKGAFTGATAQKKGRFELANNGTIFLDEVGELPLDTQTKLLRILQEQEFERIGGSETLKVNVRVIAATNRDLEDAVKNGTFRADLFYRLNIFPITVPPLRERKEDIPLLAHYFLEKFAGRMGKKIERINPDAVEKLNRWMWPGNVRELANILERAVILCQGKVLQKEHISGLGEMAAEPETFPSLEEMERRHITEALKKSGGVLAGPNGAAAMLKLHRSTLWARMQKLGINAAQI